MIDKSKLSLNARLGVKMGVRFDNGWWGGNKAWLCAAHNGKSHNNYRETKEEAANLCFSREDLRFDSDEAPRSLLHGPDGLLAFVVKAGKWGDFSSRLIRHKPFRTSELIVQEYTPFIEARILAEIADSVLPWPEGV